MDTPASLQPPRPPESATERLLPWIVGCLLALPVLVARFPPGADLANHLLEVSLLRNFGNGAMFPQGLYRLNFVVANQLFYFVAWGLSLVLPLVVAFRATVALGILLTALGAARLTRYLGRSIWTICAVMPMALGFSFLWGFATWNLAVGLLLGALPEADRFAQRPTWAGLAKALAILALLFATHELAMILFAGASLLFALGHRQSLRSFALRSLPFLAGLAASASYHVLMESRRQALELYRVKNVFVPLRERLALLPDSLFGGMHAPRTQWGLFGAVLLAFLLNALLRGGWRRSTGKPLTGFLHDWRFELLAGALFVLHLFGPNQMGGASYLADRLQHLAWTVGIIAFAPARLPRLVATVQALMTALCLAATAPGFLVADEQYRDLDELVQFVRPGSAIAQLELDLIPEVHAFSFMGGDAYFAAQRGARAMNTFAYSPIVPVVLVPEFHWPGPMQRVPAYSMLFAPGFDLTAFRYVLLKSEHVAKAQTIARLLEPEARVVAHLGWWTLLESNLRVRPAKTRLGRPPYCPETLSDRLFDRGALALEPSWLREGSAANECSAAPLSEGELSAIRELQRESLK